MNKMQQIFVEKVTLNLGTGGPGENLDKALKLLKNLTGRKPLTTKTKKRIPTWGLRPNLQIGCKVTLRKQKADEFLKKLFDAKNNTIELKNFDKNGNFSFGIPEYIDIPGTEYDMSIGIIGLEAAVTLARPGFRIRKRHFLQRKIPRHHLISKQQAIKFVKTKYNIQIEEKE